MLELDRLHKSIVAVHNTATMLTSTLNIGYIPKTLMPYREASKDLFSRFWEENPKVHAIVWTQYTPYFNDGETCYFRVGEMYPMTKENYDRYLEEDGYPEEYSIIDWNGKPEENSGLSEIEATKVSEIIKILSKIPDEVYMGMFGDHCKITATREGFQVDEYEHE